MKQKILLIAVTTALGLSIGLVNADEAFTVNAAGIPVLVAAADVILPGGSLPDMDNDHSATGGVEIPEVEHMDVDHMDVEKPDIDKPEIDHPEVDHPEVEHPDVSRPDVDHPDVSRPDVSHPDVDR